ncbi:MAG TPA: hypothetical protein VN729_03330 [Ktedonobacteraceae bacterium]|nr:hypothetical protein [Ktedonobacteraceae bacterium]
MRFSAILQENIKQGGSIRNITFRLDRVFYIFDNCGFTYTHSKAHKEDISCSNNPATAAKSPGYANRLRASTKRLVGALTGLAVGTAQHWFITRRMEHIGVHQQRLSELIGEQASMALVVAVMDDSPPQQREQMTKCQSGVSDASGNGALDWRIH